MAHIQPKNLGNLELLHFELSLQAQTESNKSCYRYACSNPGATTFPGSLDAVNCLPL